MNIFDMLGGQDQRQVEALARQFGLDEAQTRAALEQLAPVVAAGMRQQAQSAEGLGQLLNALARGTMGSMNATDADQLRTHGNDILSQIFGDKDVSRGGRAADRRSDRHRRVDPQADAADDRDDGCRLDAEVAVRRPQRARCTAALAARRYGRRRRPRRSPERHSDGGANRGQAAPPPQPRSAPGGGGLGDILGEILGGGARGGQMGRAPQGGNEIDRLREVLSDLVTGGRQQAPTQAPPQRAPQPAPQPESAPRGDGGIGDILREIPGGSPAAAATPACA